MHPWDWMRPYHDRLRETDGWADLTDEARGRRLRAAIAASPPYPAVQIILDYFDEVDRWPAIAAAFERQRTDRNRQG